MRAEFSPEQVRWFRLRRSGLVEPHASPQGAAFAVGGVQAQILSASMLALWNRSAAGAGTEKELTQALFNQRSLVRLWGQRHTLHLYPSADWPLVQGAFASRRTWWEREAARGGLADVTEYREGVSLVARLLRERQHLSRSELRESGLALPEALMSPWGGVFAELARQGLACLARWEGGEARYAHREHWLPSLAWAPPTEEEALTELARRYFRASAPASIADLAYWLGVAVGTARRAATALGAELAGAGADGLHALACDLEELAVSPPEREAWPVRMLGRFDPLLLAHKDKDWIVPDAHYARVWRPAGHIEAVVLDHGRAVATWRYDRIGSGGLRVRVFPFRARLPVRVSKALKRNAKAVAAFFGLKLDEVRVAAEPSPSPDAPYA
jgi:hypothetical protein